MTVVPAFDHPEVVAGQGTVGLEVAAEAPTCASRSFRSGRRARGRHGHRAQGDAAAVRVVGVQAEACAPYVDSLAAHRPIGARSANTICDGIAVKRPGEYTLPLVERYLDQVVTVSDDEAAQAMVLLLERSKLVVEGAGAVAVAALMAGKVEAPPTGRCAPSCQAGTWTPPCSWSAYGSARRPPAGGRPGNVVPDRPGALARLLRVVADNGGNVLDVEHLREGLDLHMRETAIQLVLQVTGREQGRAIAEAVRAEGSRCAGKLIERVSGTAGRNLSR